MLFVLKNPKQITAVEKLSIKLLILETCLFVGGKRLYYFFVKRFCFWCSFIRGKKLAYHKGQSPLLGE